MPSSSNIIEANDVRFSYQPNADKVKFVLKGVSISIKRGAYISLLGRNGSGKSTFAKLVDVLELPTEGSICVFGLDTKDESGFWEIRTHTGCVFQNPDNQIVGTTVEEDVAFGPENLGIPNPELRQRVDSALEFVGLNELKLRQTATLSGGQKQKLAIAGIFAMRPDILILDEATAMLDPVSRDELLYLVEKLVRSKKMTVLTITHDMSEAMRTDEVYIMDKGTIISHGQPNEVLTDVDLMRQIGLDSPINSKLVHELSVISGRRAELSDYKTLFGSLRWLRDNYAGINIDDDKDNEVDKEVIVRIKDLSYQYDVEAPYALEDINLDIYKGELLAIVGRSGCGKTTLISHLNGLIKPQRQSVIEFRHGDNVYTTSKKKDIKFIRQNVGLVFQYPEYQLFEETVYKDISYGPVKMGMSEDEVKRSVNESIRAVGLDEEILNESPFELSGGQQRRVAIAGVIAMRPQVLVLDEPAAGLDPRGRRDMFKMIEHLKNMGTTIVLVTHNMDEAYEHADRICCINRGKIVEVSDPISMFNDIDKIRKMEIEAPTLRRVLEAVAIKLDLDNKSKNALMKARSVRQAARLIGGEVHA